MPGRREYAVGDLMAAGSLWFRGEKSRDGDIFFLSSLLSLNQHTFFFLSFFSLPSFSSVGYTWVGFFFSVHSGKGFWWAGSCFLGQGVFL